MKLDEWLAQYDVDIRTPDSEDIMPRHSKIKLFFAWEDIGDGMCKPFVAAFRNGDSDFPIVPDNLIPGCCQIQSYFAPLSYSPPDAYINMV